MSNKLTRQQIQKYWTVDTTCHCGLYVHPDNPHASPEAIHIEDCQFSPQSIALEVRTQSAAEKTRGNAAASMGLHVLRFPSGRWGFVGDIPKVLGSEVPADNAAVMGGRAYKAKDGRAMMLKFPSFETLGMAIAHARQFGHEPRVSDTDRKAAKGDPVRVIVRGHAYDVKGHVDPADRSVGIMSDSFFADEARPVDPSSPEIQWDTLTDEEIEEIDRAFWAAQPPEQCDPIDEEQEQELGASR